MQCAVGANCKKCRERKPFAKKRSHYQKREPFAVCAVSRGSNLLEMETVGAICREKEPIAGSAERGNHF